MKKASLSKEVDRQAIERQSAMREKAEPEIDALRKPNLAVAIAKRIKWLKGSDDAAAESTSGGCPKGTLRISTMCTRRSQLQK